MFTVDKLSIMQQFAASVLHMVGSALT